MGRYKLLSEMSFYVLFLCLGFYSYVAVGGSRGGKLWSYETHGKGKGYRKQLADGGSTGLGSGPAFGVTGGLDEDGDAAFGTVAGPAGPGGFVGPGGVVGPGGAAGSGLGVGPVLPGGAAGSGTGVGIGPCGKDWKGNKHCIPGVGIGGEGGGAGNGVGGVGGESGGYASGVGGAGGLGNSGGYSSVGGGVSYGSGGGGGLGYDKGGSFGNNGGYGSGSGYDKGGSFGNNGGYGSGGAYGAGYGNVGGWSKPP